MCDYARRMSEDNAAGFNEDLFCELASEKGIVWGEGRIPTDWSKFPFKGEWRCVAGLHEWMAGYDEVKESEPGCAMCREGVLVPAGDFSEKARKLFNTIAKAQYACTVEVDRLGTIFRAEKKSLKNILARLEAVYADASGIIKAPDEEADNENPLRITPESEDVLFQVDARLPEGIRVAPLVETEANEVGPPAEYDPAWSETEQVPTDNVRAVVREGNGEIWAADRRLRENLGKQGELLSELSEMLLPLCRSDENEVDESANEADANLSPLAHRLYFRADEVVVHNGTIASLIRRLEV